MSASVAALGVPADPAFLLNGWAVVVFLVLVVLLLLLTGKVFPASTVEAERRRADMLQQAVLNGLEANLKTSDAVLKLLPLAETTVSILETMQNERDDARARGLIGPAPHGDNSQPNVEGARR